MNPMTDREPTTAELAAYNRRSYLADIWPTDSTAQSWTDSRGFTFKLLPSEWADILGWGCTLCMNDGTNPDVLIEDMVFVDADAWPWEARGQNHPAFIHLAHFKLVNRPKLVASTTS
jgi:hypothetical protein